MCPQIGFRSWLGTIEFVTDKGVMRKVLNLRSETGQKWSIFNFTFASTLHHLMIVCVTCAGLWGIIVLALGI